jgi:hypothetical protein
MQIVFGFAQQLSFRTPQVTARERKQFNFPVRSSVKRPISTSTSSIGSLLYCEVPMISSRYSSKPSSCSDGAFGLHVQSNPPHAGAFVNILQSSPALTLAPNASTWGPLSISLATSALHRRPPLSPQTRTRGGSLSISLSTGVLCRRPHSPSP